MTKKIKIALIATCALNLAGCASLTPPNKAPLEPRRCAGFSKVPLKPDSAVFLVKNDREAINAVAGNNDIGKYLQCW